jgi:hypothetical protein
MVNIKNSEIKLLKEMLDDYSKSISSEHTCLTRKKYWKYLDVYVRLNFEMEKKKELNREQYDDRLFWKKYNEAIKK